MVAVELVQLDLARQPKVSTLDLLVDELGRNDRSWLMPFLANVTRGLRRR